MLERCRANSRQAGLGRERIVVQHGDITDFEFGTQFDVVIAPYRVLQNLDEVDAQPDGLFGYIRARLIKSGRCILNVFNPNRPRDVLLKT